MTGAVPEVDRFASAWQGLTGAASRVRMATRRDRHLIIGWMERFGQELHERVPQEQFVDRRLGAGGFVLWEDGEPVSLAGSGGQTPNGVRISHVYTPP
jgi:uncharacterized protein